MAAPPGPRCLIVTSRDYGELGLATSFVRGQRFAQRATMLLPDVLYAGNQDALPARAAAYTTLEDIGRVVALERPAIVFLFSGYLLSNDRLASPQGVEAFVRQLQDQGCRVVTSDPFVGLASRLTFAQIDPRRMFAERHPLNRWLMRLRVRRMQPTQEVFRLPTLDGVIHLYPTSIPDGVQTDRARRLAYFNPAIVGAPVARPVGEQPGPTNRRRLPARWLFILSSTDLMYHVSAIGAGKFSRRVARLLRGALAAGRLPTLIAPPSFIQAVQRTVLMRAVSRTSRVRAASPDTTDLVELLPFCPLAEFERRLLQAEYVFYWNAFSASQLPRIANERPFFLFDRGHLAHLARWAHDSAPIKPFFEVALSCHLGGWEPPYLDQQQPLDPALLASLAAAQQPALRALRERWESSPTPDQVVDRLLAEPPQSGSP